MGETVALSRCNGIGPHKQMTVQIRGVGLISTFQQKRKPTRRRKIPEDEMDMGMLVRQSQLGPASGASTWGPIIQIELGPHVNQEMGN